MRSRGKTERSTTTNGRSKSHSASVQYPQRHRGPRRVPKARVSQRWIFGGIVAAAAIVTAALVLASQLGSRSRNAAQPVERSRAAGTSSLFAGIRQRGNVLGRADAPVTLVEYADLQCPYCGEFARDVLPQLVTEYVRPGRVKLVFRGIAFVGADSATALRTVLAAGARDRLWDVTHLIYANQGVENTGWITDAFLRSIVQAVPGLDPAQIARVAQSPQVAHEIAELQALANADGVDATPWFAVGRSGGRLARLQVRSLDARTFRPALDALLQA